MTLVVGRITQGGIRIDSDSKITNPNEASNQNNIFSGLLKTIVLNPNISVSYAGGVETAQLAIEELYKLGNFDIFKVKSKLLEINKDCKSETDFLIATLENQPLLYKISKGEISISNSFHWIGDIKGFNLFQSEFLPNLKSTNSKHIWSVHSKAFDKVIENSQIESVGGFHVTVHRTNFGLEYMFTTNISSGRPQTLELKQGTNVLPWGDAGTGTYSACYLKSDNPFKPAIGIHFPIGDFGTLYYPRLSREVIMYKDVNGFEFADKVMTDYKIKLIGMIKNGEYLTRI